jgi:NADH/NAD ratio-sensing transcriptional regulator Rex
MSNNELTNYKKNVINNLVNVYNTNTSNLYSTLMINIRNIQNSRQLVRTKQTQINNLITQYNNNISVLKNALNTNIQSINNFVPQKITINKNKKALLVGINYTGTQYKLNGCINDVNSI